MDAVAKFYSPDIVSVESSGSPEMPAETRGMQAIEHKHQWWMENFEVHSATVSDPLVSASNQFAVHFDYDTTFKPTGDRTRMNEMALYTVSEGKIVHEHFFYNTAPA